MLKIRLQPLRTLAFTQIPYTLTSARRAGGDGGHAEDPPATLAYPGAHPNTLTPNKRPARRW